jgi:hypothetical protein
LQQICERTRRGELVFPLTLDREDPRTKAYSEYSPQELERLSDACAQGLRTTTDPRLAWKLADNMVELALQARQCYRERRDTDAAVAVLAKLQAELQTPFEREIADSRIASRLLKAHFGERYYDKTVLLLAEGELLLLMENYAAHDRLEEAWSNALKMLEHRENPPNIWSLPPRSNVAQVSCKSATALIRRYTDLKRYDDAIKVGDTAKKALAPWVEATPADLAELNHHYELALQKSKTKK